MQPILAGGALDGWIWASFGHTNIEELYKKHGKIVVEFYDAVANRKHILTIAIPWGTLYIPELNRMPPKEVVK
jgi:hypothetical protein